MASNVNLIKRSALVYVKDIGQGAFSTVYEMTWRTPDGPVNVAAKKLNSRDKHELEVLSKLDHPNIVKLIGVVDEETDFMLVLELCEGGSLRSYLKKRNGRRLSQKQFYDFAEQAARPLEYLRENRWIHKDVKSPNYMLTLQKILKLGDFGIAKNIDETIHNATTTASYGWMAPELLVEDVLSPKFDIFALAVVLWELWTGRYPWEGLDYQVIAWRVCIKNERLPIPEDCPAPFKDLLRQCWQKEWQQRPNITQVLQVITSLSVEALDARQRHIITGPWKGVRRFGRVDGPGKLHWTNHMTISSDEDVVITDYGTSQIKIYSMEGLHKSNIHTCSRPRQIAVGFDNTCFMTDYTESITMYDLGGRYKGSWVSSCPDALSPAPRLNGLAIDHAGDLLLGDVKNKCIYRHMQDGTHIASSNVGIEPWYIAVTSQDTIVIAGIFTAPQVISNTGEVLHILQDPVDEDPHKWSPWNVYCHDGIIFVCRPGSILCYSESGEYLGSMPIPSRFYRGLAMTSDSKTLLVCTYKSVKVFTNPSIHQ